MANVRVSCFLCLLLRNVVCVTGSNDPGFELFFKTNLEERQDVPIHFDNPLPSWLKGTLIRNGLGEFERGERKFLHAFDAFGKLSSWKFYGNGSASFSTKFLESDFYKASKSKNTIAPYLLFEGVTPGFNEVEKLQALAQGIDNMNVNIYAFYNSNTTVREFVALNDFWKVYHIDQSSLATIESVTATVPKGGSGKGKFEFLNMLSSAHPLPEHGTEFHITFLSSVSLIPWVKSTISLIRMKDLRERELIASWEVGKVPYMHSFSVTKNYAVLFASPFYVNVLKMVESAKPFNSLDWNADEDTTVYVVHLQSGEVTVLKTENMFTMHHVNAYETGNNQLVVDVSSYKNPNFVSDLQIDVLMNKTKRNGFDAHAFLKRYLINLHKRTIAVYNFSSSTNAPFAAFLDMPVINEQFRHEKYCYIYGLVLKTDNISLSNIAIVKKNVCGDPSGDRYWSAPGHYPVEPSFVPTPGAAREDDGYLMFPVIDGPRRKSYLAVLDARTLQLINKSYLPTIVPYNLHGRFFGDNDLK